MRTARTIVAAAALAWLGCGARTALEITSRDAGPRIDVGMRIDAATLDAARCPFDRDATVMASVQLTVDDQARVFLEGTLLDDTPRIWSSVASYSVPLFRHPERPNVIAIEGTNTMRVDGRDRGVVLDLRVPTESGTQALVTDLRWRLVTVEEPGWFDVDHDDSAWRTPTPEGMQGEPPWGPVLGSSDATWLWSYDSDLPASAKPVGEVVFLRRRFFFDLSGHIVDTPTPCP